MSDSPFSEPRLEEIGGSRKRRTPEVPQIADANLPDALLLWMHAIQQRVDAYDERNSSALAALFFGILLGLAAGHWLL